MDKVQEHVARGQLAEAILEMNEKLNQHLTDHNTPADPGQYPQPASQEPHQD